MAKQLMFTFSVNTELPSIADHGAWFHLFNKKKRYVFDVDDILSIDKIETVDDSVHVYVTLVYVCKV